MKKRSQTSKKQFLKINVIALVIAGIVALGATVAAFYVLPAREVEQRKERITQIFDSLKLGDEYILQDENIFGEKRPYDYDKSRTFSSSREYIRGASVDLTAGELRKAIEAAGFTYFEEPYPGSVIVQWHFKSDKGEYVRLSVSSKPRDDAFQNAVLMNNPVDDAANMDANAGPANVIIKVNLDDNNE